MEILKIFRNELKNSKPPKYKIIGIVSEMILSKELFEKNLEIKLFLKEVFDKEFNAYVYASRTLIISRTVRLIAKSEDKEYLTYKNKLYKFTVKRIDSSKSTQKNTFDGWL
ncbi:hypothetical protein [Bacillus altitudinis]|uniref:hypothetical protein n=1 Tax=Bacillus altitudinis TaxID=293387 RepID=UPI003CE7E9AE